ncbi:MAG: helix-turn-helix domain-containing protein [Candidatus Binataceae bacterium]
MLKYDGEKLLSAAQVAEMLGVRPVTVRAWLARRLLASVKVGERAVRIPQSEVARLVARGYTPARPERAGDSER